MIFRRTQLSGAWLIEPEPHKDERGFFARTWCRDEYARRGLDAEIAQESVSYSAQCGTLRGLHFQRAPHQETKIVRCTHGAICDVIVDLRRSSNTYLKWQAFELTCDKPVSLYVPKGFAHGFQTLTDNAQASYQISVPYAPDAGAGFRHDDPAFAIEWPLPVSMISRRDAQWPAFRDALAEE